MPKKTNSKLQSLRAHGTLHPRPHMVDDPLFHESPFFDPADALQVKYEMLRRVRIEGAAVLHAARAFGFSRPAFYQAARAFERDGIAGLLPAKRGPKGAHKLSDDVVAWALSRLGDDPSLSVQTLADLVLGEFGIEVHPRSIARAIERYEKKRVRLLSNGAVIT